MVYFEIGDSQNSSLSPISAFYPTFGYGTSNEFITDSRFVSTTLSWLTPQISKKYLPICVNLSISTNLHLQRFIHLNVDLAMFRMKILDSSAKNRLQFEFKRTNKHVFINLWGKWFCRYFECSFVSTWLANQRLLSLNIQQRFAIATIPQNTNPLHTPSVCQIHVWMNNSRYCRLK